MTSKQLAREFERDAKLCEDFVSLVESSEDSNPYQKEFTIMSRDGLKYRLVDVT